MAKKILLTEWAKAQFDPPPGIGTLRAWAKTKQILPYPEKIAGKWMVDENAKYVKIVDGDEIIRKILNDTKAA